MTTPYRNSAEPPTGSPRQPWRFIPVALLAAFVVAFLALLVTVRAAVVALLLFSTAGVAIAEWVGALRRAPGIEGTLRGSSRGGAALALAATVVGAIGLPLLLAEDERMPVEVYTSTGCGLDPGLSFGAGAHAINVAAYLLPLGIAFLVARRRSAPPISHPSGRALFALALTSAMTVLLLLGVRRSFGGVPPAAFTTYGALTPDGARGLPVRALLAQHVGGSRFEEIRFGPPIDQLTTHIHGSDCCGPLSHGSTEREDRGAIAVVSGTPGVLTSDEGGPIFRPLEPSASPSVSLDKRPHFEALPRVAATLPPIYVERRRDGSTFVFRAARAAYRSDVGLLLTPPTLPIVIVAVGIAIAAAFRRVPGTTRIVLSAIVLACATVAFELSVDYL